LTSYVPVERPLRSHSAKKYGRAIHERGGGNWLRANPRAQSKTPPRNCPRGEHQWFRAFYGFSLGYLVMNRFLLFLQWLAAR